MTERQKTVTVPKYRFIKVEVQPTEEDLEAGNFQWLKEPDTLPDADGFTTVLLAKENYPRALAFMSAQRAGEWAVRRCIANGWEPTPLKIGSALANLEIDLD